jgi:CBS domain-containing protein
MTHKKAKDLMVEIKEYLRPQTSVKDAVVQLKTTRRSEEKYGVKGMPVVDEHGKLVGMLSIGDITRAIYPYYMQEANLGEVAWDGMLEAMARRLREKKVGDIMDSNVMPVHEDATLMECLDHMIKKDVPRVPVVDESGLVIGVIYERDLFNVITDAIFALGNKG